ncbi:OmpA family protein [Marinilabilia salmonicolor]|uniref:OmpA family protein n=1 Tax=Marinilabilia salmonicolor TaxID=989 RepID=UPI00029B1C90|nr:OmpA family protein [Marinilabilia salmonicolor]
MRIFGIIIFIFFATFVSEGQNRRDSLFVLTPDMIFSFGQSYNSWSVSAGFGPVFMYADQSGYSLFPNEEVDFGPSLQVTKHLVPAFAFEMQYLQSDMFGRQGDYGFRGDLMDISINGIAIINQMSAHPGPVNDKWNYYLKIGVGATLFRSRLFSVETGEVVRRSQLYNSSNPDYVVLGYDVKNPEEKTSRATDIVLPFGAGLMYRINNRFDVGVESILRFSASDRLDNILTGATNDRYLYTSLNISYKFGDKDRRHMRWTYRAEGMDVFGRPQEDPLLAEIRQLEEDIDIYEANRPVHKDSVVITETLRVVYDQYNVRTIFFPPGHIRRFSPADQLLMGRIAVELNNHDDKKLTLYGYADSDGDSEKNMEISRERCLAVKEYFVYELGLNPGRISIVPLGEENPLSPVSDLSPRGLKMANRRVDLVVE